MQTIDTAYQSEFRATEAADRSQFLSRTYGHLTGAIFLFAAVEVLLFRTGVAQQIVRALTGVSWLIVLGGFMVVGWLASRTAAAASSRAAQYLALTGFVAAEAVIFVPLLYVAESYAPGAIGSAALVTFLGFAGLTTLVFVTRKDFSFLRTLLFWGGVVALLLIVASVLFGWNLGTWFSVGMIALAGGAVLHDTSEVLHRFPEDRYVAAALQLFASVALMFWYVLRLLTQLRR